MQQQDCDSRIEPVLEGWADKRGRVVVSLATDESNNLHQGSTIIMWN